MGELALNLARWQFAATTVYHFFFVPLTLGLSVIVAIMETIYVSTGNVMYKRMTKFWGKLFVINFAMGVVTGIVQEFQFGMNWSEYSRYVGDIFGAPLAIEALLAFFLESTFLGIWLFGWDKLPKRLHAVSIWLVAIGSNVSAFWILVANSFMQSPQGFVEEGGRLVMNDFGALLTNPNVWVQFPHTVTAGFTTGAFFVLGISAYHLIKKTDKEFFGQSFKLATIFGLVSVLLVITFGHASGQHMVRSQPMKMAAMEALWESEDPASYSILSIVDEKNQEDIVSIRIPAVLSFMSYNKFEGEVQGIKNLQAEYENLYGEGNYVPPITITYWAFRIMVGSAMLMLLVALVGLFFMWKKRDLQEIKLLRFVPFIIAFPYLANTTGWILTELGRQPWVVYGYLKTADAVSPNVSSGMLWTSLIGFVLVYGLLMVADIYLLTKYAKAGPAAIDKPEKTDDESMWK